jgi:hypothetical protein
MRMQNSISGESTSWVSASDTTFAVSLAHTGITGYDKGLRYRFEKNPRLSRGATKRVHQLVRHGVGRNEIRSASGQQIHLPSRRRSF